jgi:hypothetical protein
MRYPSEAERRDSRPFSRFAYPEWTNRCAAVLAAGFASSTAVIAAEREVTMVQLPTAVARQTSVKGFNR